MNRAAVFAFAALATAPAWAADEPARVSRPSLLSSAQPLWSDLTAAQREVLGPLETQWNAMPAAKKTAWIAFVSRFGAMKPADQERARERIRDWAALTPEQRGVARANFRLAEPLPRDERVVTWQQYQTMTPEQQQVLRSAGSTSNTAAGHAGSPTGLAKQAGRPVHDAARTPAAASSFAPAAAPQPDVSPTRSR